MKINGWKYYNHAAIPKTAPHEKVDVHPIKDKTIWKMDGNPYFARWADNFDCGFDTGWWYCIKDEPFDISKINSKKRCEINKAKKNFDVHVIDPTEYVDEIAEVQKNAWKNYPEAYRPDINIEKMKKNVLGWEVFQVFGAFGIDNGKLQPFHILTSMTRGQI